VTPFVVVVEFEDLKELKNNKFLSPWACSSKLFTEPSASIVRLWACNCQQFTS